MLPDTFQEARHPAMELDIASDFLLTRPMLPSLGLASVALVMGCLVLLAMRGSRKGRSDETGGGKGTLAPEPVVQKPKVTILFGTQTGTAERFAKQLRYCSRT